MLQSDNSSGGIDSGLVASLLGVGAIVLCVWILLKLLAPAIRRWLGGARDGTWKGTPWLPQGHSRTPTSARSATERTAGDDVGADTGSSSRIAALESELAHRNARLSATLEEMRALRTSLESIRGERDTRDAEQASARARLEEARRELDATRQDRDDARRDRDETRRDLDEARRELDEARRDLGNLRREAESRLDSVDALRREVECSRHECNVLRETLQGQSRQIEDLQERLDISRSKSDNYSILQNMQSAMQTCGDPADAAAVAGEYAARLYSADSGGIYVADAAGTGFELIHHWGRSNESAHRIRMDDCVAIRGSRPAAASADQSRLRCRHLHLGTGRHSYCLPLEANGQITGMISMRRDAPFRFEDAGQESAHEIAEMFASSTAQFLSSLALRKRLEDQSLRDPLTHLFNRRYFTEQLAVEFERTYRSRSPLSVLMIDIDHFKRINDRFGHDAGDRALSFVAEQLQYNARSGDIVCRWGGEEFLILMPGSNSAAAQRRADQIRLRVHEQANLLAGHRLSVSIGVATCPDHATEPQSLIEASDRALYAAKDQGRNRVVVATHGT